MVVSFLPFSSPYETLDATFRKCTFYRTLYFCIPHDLRLNNNTIIIIIIINLTANGLLPGGSGYNACTYLLTPRCRVLLEKLTDLQLVKKFPAFHGTQRFITALTSVRHLSLSWASPIQSIYPHLTSWRSILILSTHQRLGLPRVSFPPVYPARPYTSPSPRPYAPHAQPISFFSI